MNPCIHHHYCPGIYCSFCTSERPEQEKTKDDQIAWLRKELQDALNARMDDLKTLEPFVNKKDADIEYLKGLMDLK